jgi:hypothetical protein
MVAMLARVLVLLAVSTLSWSKPPKVVSRPRSIALDGAKASAAPPNATAADESGPRHLTEFTVREPPVFSPDGGTFLAPVAVSLSATDGDAASTNGPHRVFYTTDGTQPTRESASVESGTVVVMSKPGVLRAFVRSPSVADKVDTDGALDGPEYSAYFGVETYRSGVAYLVPYVAKARCCCCCFCYDYARATAAATPRRPRATAVTITTTTTLLLLLGN